MEDIKESVVAGFRIDKSVYKAVKIRCVQRNESVKDYVTRALIKQLAEEEQYDSTIERTRMD